MALDTDLVGQLMTEKAELMHALAVWESAHMDHTGAQRAIKLDQACALGRKIVSAARNTGKPAA